MDKVRYAIVGAGVSGLSFADRLQDDDYLIFEANDEIGGYCRTVRQDGFIWDYSGHFFHFRQPEIEQELVRRMGPDSVLRVQRDSRIYFGSRFVDFPFQKNIHQLGVADFARCLRDLLVRQKGEPVNFKDMLYKKFGQGIAELFLIPYNEKLYATDLSSLDVDAMGRFFPHASLKDILKNIVAPDNQSYNATFTYPRGGAIQYVEAIAQGVDADKICMNERVTAIDLGTKTLTTTRRQVRFEQLISSAPFVQLLQMLGEPVDPSVYSYNKVEIFNLGFDKKGMNDVHWVYVPQRDLCFYRVGFYDNIMGEDRMSLYIEIGHPADRALPEGQRQATLARVLDDLRKAGLVTDQELVSHHHVVLDPAYVHITTRSIAEVKKTRAALGAQGVHSIGRYGGWTYCSIEDNMIEARALADRFNQAAR